MKALGAEMAAQMDLSEGLELEIHVVEGKEVNAFTTLGGHIFVLEGLIERLDNENSLAMVLGHEIAHAAKQTLTSLSRGILLQLPLTTATGRRAPPDLGGQLVLTAYSRELEENADGLALDAQSLYGHAGATGFLEEPREVEVFAPAEFRFARTSRAASAPSNRCDERGRPMEETAPYPDAVLEGLSLGLDQAASPSPKLPVMMMIVSNSVQTPRPPKVSSIGTPVPILPK